MGGAGGGREWPIADRTAFHVSCNGRSLGKAIGDDWDPVAVLAEEEKAYDMLYSDLDAEQQRIYDELVQAGVLPSRTADRVSD